MAIGNILRVAENDARLGSDVAEARAGYRYLGRGVVRLSGAGACGECLDAPKRRLRRLENFNLAL